MIDWTALVDALDVDNYEEVLNAVRAREIDEAETLAQTIVLGFDEVKLARENRFHAAVAVRNRIGCSILVAKTAVELVLESDKDEEAAREDGGDYVQYGEAADDFAETVIGIDQAFSD